MPAYCPECGNFSIQYNLHFPEIYGCYICRKRSTPKEKLSPYEVRL